MVLSTTRSSAHLNRLSATRAGESTTTGGLSDSSGGEVSVAREQEASVNNRATLEGSPRSRRGDLDLRTRLLRGRIESQGVNNGTTLASAGTSRTTSDLSNVPGQGNYTHAYVLVAPETTGPTGHAMMAFGDANGPQVVFNQGGAGGGPWGDDAKISRMSWDQAKEYLIPEGIDYQVHAIQSEPENIRKMFDSFNGVFEAAEGDGITRTRDYHVLWNNCTTLTRDALRAGGMNISGGIFRPTGLGAALDRQARDTRNRDGVDVRRSMIIHGAEGQGETASPWR